MGRGRRHPRDAVPALLNRVEEEGAGRGPIRAPQPPFVVRPVQGHEVEPALPEREGVGREERQRIRSDEDSSPGAGAVAAPEVTPLLPEAHREQEVSALRQRVDVQRGLVIVGVEIPSERVRSGGGTVRPRETGV
jgi:hypothetical protein